MNISELQKTRNSYKPKLPEIFNTGAKVNFSKNKTTTAVDNIEEIAKLFPKTYGKSILQVNEINSNSYPVINVGVILSGGQAPGGHNVISGIFDGIKSLNPKSKLYGFLQGPAGLINNNYTELTSNIINQYRNTGGFDIIGSGRTKLEGIEQYNQALENCRALNITALVIIGGDDSNTNGCVLAEYYQSINSDIKVIGCPKTIDGDLKNKFIETSFGFDTACKVYSELIGNLARDAISAKKYWHFIKVMGRSASHIALECGLQTQVNITLISEEIESKNMTLAQIVNQISQIICTRANNKKDFGLIIIPEGLIEFIPEMKILISKLNDLLAHNETLSTKISSVKSINDLINLGLEKNIANVYFSLPDNIRKQLVMDRDPHGNVQVSRIETEKLLITMVENNLEKLKNNGQYTGSFSAHNHFFGYEGRCAAPSNFDADYCYSLGYSAAALIGNGQTAYLSSIRNLTAPAKNWIAGGVPFTSMMNIEKRHGSNKPVIRKALVRLNDSPFKKLASKRKKWEIENHYLYPGSIQYFGPTKICNQISQTLKLEQSNEQNL